MLDENAHGVDQALFRILQCANLCLKYRYEPDEEFMVGYLPEMNFQGGSIIRVRDAQYVSTFQIKQINGITTAIWVSLFLLLLNSMAIQSVFKSFVAQSLAADGEEAIGHAECYFGCSFILVEIHVAPGRPVSRLGRIGIGPEIGPSHNVRAEKDLSHNTSLNQQICNLSDYFRYAWGDRVSDVGVLAIKPIIIGERKRWDWACVVCV
ncbi:hypothetical protein L484_004023 [Morus notabilis]|uniref:Uncharacterized protein n=1 Tax=Morus notabilis TaxID=981085 RepID=W9RAD5_9ROSA|nr:hypothetical protein L484_004023 [Morus notabilis]